MGRKIFKSGNSLVVALPREAIEMLGLHEGSELNVAVDEEEQRIILSPERVAVTDIDATFARQLEEFIAQYRSALEALAK
jgi:putative addiction module antidote